MMVPRLWGVLLIVPLALPAQTRVDFARDVEPILRARCQGCHGSGMQMSGLRLDQRESALHGGKSGAVILPGNSAGSRLLQLVTASSGIVMPPAPPRLSPEEITTLRKWVDEGASWPEGLAKNSHWSYQPIRRPALPALSKQDWARNPIDAFILARLEKEGIAPSPETDRATLLRRLSFDLIGLPPTPAELEDFLADQHPDAYERVVDHLLASPHYGEKWARPWLDLARYADSDGYEKDLVRQFAWRYRHWVIEALNRDMPFDQFSIDQIAGDLLPDATTEQKVATGFQRNTLTNREGGVNLDQGRFEQLVDRTNTFGTTWLGLTVGCAQCHDHKYDAIKQKEYYQFQAFFNQADEADIDAPLPGEVGPYLAAQPEYIKQRRKLLEEYKEPAMQAEYERQVLTASVEQGKNSALDVEWDTLGIMLDHGREWIHIPVEKRTFLQDYRLTRHFLNQGGAVFGKQKWEESKMKELRDKLRALDEAFPSLTMAQIMVDKLAPQKSYLYLRGDFRNKGAEVEPGVLAVLPRLPDGLPSRLTLTRWLFLPENPLPARVAVNRMWQEFFGRGLVNTSEDFGMQGEKPTHPELLDWLASEFKERGWSVKQMHRLIVTSATYRQSSKVRQDVQSRDPYNTLLARQSRLRFSGEAIRDAALSASGLLDTRVGGRSIRPPIPPGVMDIGYAESVKWAESKGAEKYRRGLYILAQRTVPYPQLANFDEPNSNLTCSRRQRSNTPLQALNLLNDPVYFEASQALAARVMQESAAGFDARLDRAFELCLSRKPTVHEKEWIGQYYQQQLALPSTPEHSRFPAVLEGIDPREAGAWAGVSRVLLNLDEFITKE